MIPLALSEIAELVHGEVVGADIVVTGPASVDSRAALPGGLFVASVGAHVDGHDFVSDAVARGAVAVLGARPTSAPTVVVADPLAALALLAAAVRQRLSATVIALTGSQGKTSTKDLLAALFSEAGPTVATAGNLNNEVGVPLTVLRADEHTRYLVLEMGARGEGHIAELCAVAQPTIGAVLSVGTAHLSEFGSPEAVARAKGELVECLPSSGTAVLNADDPAVRAMAARTQAAVVWWSANGAASDWRAGDVHLDDKDRARFVLTGPDGVAHPVALLVSGAHQVANALAAAALAGAAGLSAADVARGLSAAAVTSRWRMEVTERAGVTVINDSYNANEDSMAAALGSLQRMSSGRRSVAVLGEMRELGDESRAAHVRLGQRCVEAGVEVVVLVGAVAPWVIAGLNDSVRIITAARGHHATEWLRHNIARGDVVLVKASRAAELDLVAAALLTDLAEGEGKQ